MFLHSIKSSGRPLTKQTMSASAAVEVALHPELSHAEEVVVGRLVEVEEPQPLAHQLVPVVSKGHQHAVTHQCVLLPVGCDQGLRSSGGCDLPQCVLVGCVRQAWVELLQLPAQGACQDHLAVRGAAQKTVGAEVLIVVGVDRLPAELLKVIGGGLLNEGGFGVGARCHGLNLCLI